MKSVNRAKMTLLATGIALLCGQANADAVYASADQMTYYGYASFSGGNADGFNTGYNGQQQLTVNNGSTYDPTSLYSDDVWCIDLSHNIWLGAPPGVNNEAGIIYTVGTLADFTTDFAGHSVSTTQAEEIAAVAWYGNYLLEGGGATPSNDIGDAVEALITSIEYNTSYNGGDANVASEIVTIESWLDKQVLADYSAQIFYVADPGAEPGGTDYAYQALIMGFYNPPDNLVVPEPLTLSLVGAGLLAAVGVRRRRKAAKSS
jgi:PEP-CTERM motif